MDLVNSPDGDRRKLIVGSAALFGTAPFCALIQTCIEMERHRIAHDDVAPAQIVIAALLCGLAVWAGSARRRSTSSGAALALAAWGFAQTASPHLLFVSPLPPFVHLLAGFVAILTWSSSRRRRAHAA